MEYAFYLAIIVEYRSVYIHLSATAKEKKHLAPFMRVSQKAALEFVEFGVRVATIFKWTKLVN